MSEMNFTKSIKFFYRQVRGVSSQVGKKPKNHYASLGVSAKATQSDIKAAYYKLSMIYHPDKNKDSAAEEKFRDISEAYETLSNVQSRKFYDRGLFMKTPSVPYDDLTENKFYKSRDVKSKPPVPEGRSAVYNYDEWSRAHYQATFHRDLHFKHKQDARRAYARKKMEDSRMESVVLCLAAFLVLYIIFSVKSDFDSRCDYVTEKSEND